MTLPVSGTISMSQVSTELGRASSATTSLGETAVRTLAGVASGAIAFSNLHGKSNYSLTNPTPGGVVYREVLAPSAATAYMYAHPDGVFVGIGDTTDYTQFGNLWQTNIASAKYWKWTQVSGSTPNYTNMTAGVWYPVNGSYYVGTQRSGSNGTTEAVVAISMANDSGGSGATTAGNWTITAVRTIA